MENKSRKKLTTTKKRVSNKKKQAKKPNKSRKWLILAALLAVVGAVALGYVLVNGADDDVIIKIPRGAKIENVEDSIAKYLGDEYAAMVVSVMSPKETLKPPIPGIRMEATTNRFFKLIFISIIIYAEYALSTAAFISRT